MKSESKKAIESSSFICSGCTCLCDDLKAPELEFSTGQPVKLFDLAGNRINCERSIQWLSSLNQPTGHRIDGQTATFEEAIAEAQRQLAGAQAPLICGLDGLCTKSQQAAWRLADRQRAIIDTNLSHADRGGETALQQVGRVTATLGEVAQRSDLLIFWFCNPVKTHPRLIERIGRLQKRGNRKIVVVDSAETETSAVADRFFILDRKLATLTLQTLRAQLDGRFPNRSDALTQNGLPIKSIEELLQLLTSTKYGAIFSSPPGFSAGVAESVSLARFVRGLNRRTRVVNLPLRNDGNSLSAENVLAWSCGFSFAINLQQGFPRSCGLEFSAESVLTRKDCDLILLASTQRLEEQWRNLNEMAQQNFLQVPKIVLSAGNATLNFLPKVEISVGRPGHTVNGDFCRFDDVPLRLQPIENIPSPLSAAKVLDQL